MEARLYREFFRALSNQTRFSIVQLLRHRPHYVNEMAEKLGMEQSRVSHNLACLLNCGFVEWGWNGKNKVYRLNSDLQPVLNGIEKHLAKYAPALDSCKTLANESKPVVMIAKANEPGLRHRTFGRKGKRRRRPLSELLIAVRARNRRLAPFRRAAQRTVSPAARKGSR